MASEGTTLCVVNNSGMDITNITVTNIDNYDWGDDTNRPDHNFQGASIPNNDSRCEHEELNKHANGVSFGMSLTFSNGTSLSFTGNQQDAFTKHDGVAPISGTATGTLQLYQMSGGGSNSYSVQTIQPPDNSGWMGALLARNSDVAVNQITMPGSHDAGMYTIGSTTTLSQPEWAQTQNLSIFGQLTAGSRYFDLRVYYDGEQYRTGHFSGGQGSFGPLLSDVLDQVKSFITSPAAAKEAVFLKFSHTSSGYNSKLDTNEMTQAVVNMVESKLGDVLYKATNAAVNLATLPLATLSGKICAVFDYEYGPWINQGAGIYRYSDVPEDGKAAIVPGLNVYDNYSGTDSLDDMRADQMNKLASYGGYGKDYLFLMSWTLTGDAGLADVEVLAGMANPWLPMTTTSAVSAPTKPNVVYYDYVNPYLCRCIIDVNG